MRLVQGRFFTPGTVIWWASCQIRKIVGCACAGNAGNVFPATDFKRKTLVSDTGMHHVTCVTHVPWCMSGSLTHGDEENDPGIPGACATRNFTYLVRGPLPLYQWVVIGIHHDTVCAGVGGTAIRHSTSCAGRRAAVCGRAGRHNECCAWWQYHPRQRRPYKWSISILPRSQFYKKQGKLAFSTSCTAVRPHRRLRNDAWRQDS